ncbi:MAG: MipA/OmpV family protein [Calditrichaeota bacterium]|nr:MipA/OmpV family protein [Calditrichota bacterium]
MKIIRKILLGLFVLSGFVFSQSIIEPAYGLWGLGMTNRDRNYINSDSDISFSPFIFGGFGPIWVEANRFGYTFYRDGIRFMSVAGMLRSHQFREKSPDISERKASFEMGLQAGMHLPGGFVSRLAFMHDISSRHKSYELDLQLYRHDNLGPLRLLSAIGLQYQSQKLVNYYYGTSNYNPKAAFAGELEFIVTYPFTDWAIFSGIRTYIFDKHVRNSPVADGAVINNVFTGIGIYL